MPITPPITPPAPRRYTALDIITNAMVEAGWLSPGEPPNSDEAQFMFSKLNDMLDTWAAQHSYAYAEVFGLFTLVAGLSPHTIGPDAATFSTDSRPVRMESASIVIANNSGTTTDLPIHVRDADWWANVRIKDLQSQIPTDLWYNPTDPNGSCYFWPVPNAQYQARLEWWQWLGQFPDIQTTFTFPPSYRRALTLSLAEEMAGPRSNDPTLQRAAYDARLAIRANNAPGPRIATSAGMPQSSSRPRFNFLTGQPW